MNSVSLYLLRHGAIVSAAAKTFIGQIDAPLSQEGIKQAWALRQYLEPVKFTRILSSDLSRCQHTCNIIAGHRNLSLEIMPALREVSLGEWDGVSFSEIQNRFPEQYAARGQDLENWRPPVGESFADCRIRVKAALRAMLAASEGNVLLVAHAGVNRVILCDILGIPLQNMHALAQEYGCINMIEFKPPHASVRLMNYTPASTPWREPHSGMLMMCQEQA